MNIDEILTFINNFESNTKQELFFQKKLNYYFNILFYINNNNHNQDNEEIEQELENKGIIYDGCYIEGSSLYNIMKHIIQLVRILSNHKKLVITYKNFN